jgi:predicted metalloendopeptidase
MRGFLRVLCGEWHKKNPIPPDQSSWATYIKLEDENRAQLKTILEAAEKASGARDAVIQKIGDYYASCMDEAAIEKLGAQPHLPELERTAGLKSKHDLAEYVATAQYPPSLEEGGTLFTFRSNQSFKDSTQVIAEADQGGLGLQDRDYYLKDGDTSKELRKAHLAHVAKMFELLGTSRAMRRRKRRPRCASRPRGLTPERRFFVTYGQSWCTNERDENKRLRATVDPHSPEKYRANGVVANLTEFRAALRCKPGQLMVRENACGVVVGEACGKILAPYQGIASAMSQIPRNQPPLRARL